MNRCHRCGEFFLDPAEHPDPEAVCDGCSRPSPYRPQGGGVQRGAGAAFPAPVSDDELGGVADPWEIAGRILLERAS